MNLCTCDSTSRFLLDTDFRVVSLHTLQALYRLCEESNAHTDDQALHTDKHLRRYTQLMVE